jgi:hypothetical protein
MQLLDIVLGAQCTLLLRLLSHQHCSTSSHVFDFVFPHLVLAGFMDLVSLSSIIAPRNCKIYVCAFLLGCAKALDVCLVGRFSSTRLF